MTPDLTKRLLASFREAVRNALGGGGDESEPDTDPRRDGGGEDDDRHLVYLAAFGKHPGWDDHVDDMGLETDLLVWVKRLLYLEGIANNIDTGAWEQLQPAERLEKFDHAFLWRADDALVIGRLWSSTDGKGRAKYPMVLAAQCSVLPAEWVVANVPARLDALYKGCVATRNAGAVRALVDEARRELRAAADHAVKTGGAAAAAANGSVNPVECFATSPDMGADHKGLLSVLYEIEHEMGAFRPGMRDSQAGASHLRVPACAPDAYQAMHQWIEFLEMQVDASAPILAIQPFGEKWVDLIVGEPNPRDLFCIRATRKKVPLTSDIPYNLTPEFVCEAEEFIAQHRDR